MRFYSIMCSGNLFFQEKFLCLASSKYLPVCFNGWKGWQNLELTLLWAVFVYINLDFTMYCLKCCFTLLLFMPETGKESEREASSDKTDSLLNPSMSPATRTELQKTKKQSEKCIICHENKWGQNHLKGACLIWNPLPSIGNYSILCQSIFEEKSNLVL